MAMKDARLTTLEEAFKAFADPTRLRILGLLAGGEICVCNIHECLGIPQPTASRHLALVALSGAITPSIVPCPNISGCLEVCLACP